MMQTGEERHDYFEWLIFKVSGDIGEYYKLYWLLFNTDFNYKDPADGNRYEDGVNLRYEYGRETGLSQAEVVDILDFVPCSMLEMMVALAMRIEHDIMADNDADDKTYMWFDYMMHSAGFDAYPNYKFDKEKVLDIVDDIYQRRYSADGMGGLFHIPGTNRDLRSAEIWYQAMWYISYREKYKRCKI